jgi:hypothetical protein
VSALQTVAAVVPLLAPQMHPGVAVPIAVAMALVG